MTDDDERAEPLRRWLAGDLFVLNTVLLVAATSLALALTVCLWHYIHPEPPPSLDQPSGNAPSILSAALSRLGISPARTTPSGTQQPSLAVLAPEQKDRKSTRSKERRRRGKDPFRDLLKGGKKSKVLLKAVKTSDHDGPPPFADMLSNSTAAADDTASSTSRSQSPEPARDLDHRALRLDVSSDDGAVEHTVPDDSTSSTLVSIDISDPGSVDACSPADTMRPHAVPPDSTISADTLGSSSTAMGHASEDAPSSPPVSTACAPIRTRPSRNSQAASVSGNCAKLVRARTRLRLSRIEAGIKSSLIPATQSTSSDNTAHLSPCARLGVPCPSLPIIPSTHSTATPTNSRGSSPIAYEVPAQSFDQSAARAQIQLAAMHSALEAARQREEQLRMEAEQASKERDQLRWRWSEDTGLWRRREAELQAQIYHLMQQLQAYAAIASFQAQQASTSSGFSSPTSPHAHSSPRLQHHPPVPFPLSPIIQAQNSASPPAHVQAMLASAPMLASHPSGFAAPASATLYLGTDLSRSPLLRSGLGLSVPPRRGGQRTPDSSASGSSGSRRGRGHADNVRNASDESSLGEWDGIEDGSGDEDRWEEEDIFRNNALADAILKRPESIRELRGNVGKRLGVGRGRPRVHGVDEMGRGGAEERMDALKDPALEKHGFASPFIDTLAATAVGDEVNGQ